MRPSKRGALYAAPTLAPLGDSMLIAAQSAFTAALQAQEGAPWVLCVRTYGRAGNVSGFPKRQGLAAFGLPGLHGTFSFVSLLKTQRGRVGRYGFCNDLAPKPQTRSK